MGPARPGQPGCAGVDAVGELEQIAPALFHCAEAGGERQINQRVFQPFRLVDGDDLDQFGIGLLDDGAIALVTLGDGEGGGSQGAAEQQGGEKDGFHQWSPNISI
mgnify:CR=1 FL=1